MEYQVDLQRVKTVDQLHDQLEAVLPLPLYYGRNLDALHDTLTSMTEEVTISFVHAEDAEEPLRHYLDLLQFMCENVERECPNLHFLFDYPWEG